MASIDDGELLLEIPGASHDELEEGLVAARRIFAGRAVTPAEAFGASFKVGDPDAAYSPEEWEQAAVIERALEAAERAACGTWQDAPEGCELSRLEPGEVRQYSDLDEPHYRMRPSQPLPELPLGLAPLPDPWPERTLEAAE